ncbi:MAG: hypothetical protein JXR91_06080 [Deltaproteobacteria bacterium]|nr:hypothetical protein [Deltaproteobacteria bacterium]
MKNLILFISIISALFFVSCKDDNSETKSTSTDSQNINKPVGDSSSAGDDADSDSSQNNDTSVNDTATGVTQYFYITKDDTDTALYEELYQKELKLRVDTCDELCKKSVKTGCTMPFDECMTNCNLMNDTIMCTDQNIAYIFCELEASDEQLTCTEFGFITLVDGACSKEIAELNKCVEAVL